MDKKASCQPDLIDAQNTIFHMKAGSKLMI